VSAAEPGRLPQPDRDRAHIERLLDDALRETFPASDPVSVFTPDARVGHGAAPRR